MAWSLAHAKLHTLLRKQILLPVGSRLLIAVSGGQDSLCLARLLLDLQAKWQWSLALVHCNHQWREDADENAEHVNQLAKAWQVPCQIAVTEQELNSEATAREWRYQTFAQIAHQKGYGYVVTGHTGSDRAETTLYNLIRGTSIDGLSALPWRRALSSLEAADVQLVRPLLNFSRQETQAFCQQQQLPVWEDSSNANLKFRRNRIRRELLPYLREHFNPQVERSLCQLAEITAADVDYLNAQAAQLYTQVVVEVSPVHPEHQAVWEICIESLSLAPVALQRRVIKRLLQVSLPKPPGFQQIEELRTLLKSPNGSKTGTYPGGLTARVHKPVIRLETSKYQKIQR